ncbi:MAG: hypothetical protein N2578_06925, partial [Bdellovibrionaceae bacterium]|nr:hypothetical protein [Pseudobdellovibrionaceae bacterium]
MQWEEVLSSDQRRLQEIGSQWGINHLALEDLINRNQRAKIEDFENHHLLVWFALFEDSVHEIQFLFFSDKILCVPDSPPPSGKTWFEYLRLSDSSKDVEHLLYSALDRLTDLTAACLKPYFERIEQFEVTLFDEKQDPK